MGRRFELNGNLVHQWRRGSGVAGGCGIAGRSGAECGTVVRGSSVGRFEPEHLGKLASYVEARDREVRKPHENPAIGVLLCASKDDEVVEYALSRTASLALIAQYRTQLAEKDAVASEAEGLPNRRAGRDMQLPGPRTLPSGSATPASHVWKADAPASLGTDR